MQNSFQVHAEYLADRLRQGNVVVFTGAGMSTDSGLADFRSIAKGLWGKYDPMRLATIDCLMNRYSEFRDFYKMRLDVIKDVKPNVGHMILAKWEKRGFLTGLITQNVDGLHQMSGLEKILTIHGNLRDIRCSLCNRQFAVEDFMEGRVCTNCGGNLRPAVVLFGESVEHFELAQHWTETCETFVVLGSSLLVTPANVLPQKAKAKGAALVIVNNDATPLDSLADCVVHHGIAEYLEVVDQLLGKV